MSFMPDRQTLVHIVVALNAGVYVLLGVIAGLWWLPKAAGDDAGIPRSMAAVCYVMLWIWVFNDLPRLGVRRFLVQCPLLVPKVVYLAVVGAAFGYGFMAAASGT
jgi:hypothetical protein